ncbi:hypothetical protein CEXT_368512 [Caerostris extrusa]|nr:hypothetical protein CEXT_368512 [Caerostris extrusa]
MYYTDDGSNINISVSSPEKQNNNNYKSQCSSSNVESVETPSNLLNNNNKKNSDSVNIFTIDLPNSDVSDPNNQDLKQNKTAKARKSKSLSDLEPPSKKMKEGLDSSSKSSSTHMYQNGEEIERKSVPTPQSNMLCEERQVSSESNVSENDHSGIDSLGHFGNQIHLTDNNCKTPTSVDAIFSLTPMLGDIYKRCFSWHWN